MCRFPTEPRTVTLGLQMARNQTEPSEKKMDEATAGYSSSGVSGTIKNGQDVSFILIAVLKTCCRYAKARFWCPLIWLQSGASADYGEPLGRFVAPATPVILVHPSPELGPES